MHRQVLRSKVHQRAVCRCSVDRHAHVATTQREAIDTHAHGTAGSGLQTGPAAQRCVGIVDVWFGSCKAQAKLNRAQGYAFGIGTQNALRVIAATDTDKGVGQGGPHGQQSHVNRGLRLIYA